jgi:nucleoside-diphosphate-sugar epimerase
VLSLHDDLGSGGEVLCLVKSEEQATSISPNGELAVVVLPEPDVTFWRDLFASNEEVTIFNFASKSSVAASWNRPSDFFSPSLSNLSNLLVAMRDSSNKKLKLIHPSTVELYSHGSYAEFEPTIDSLLSPYAIQKAAELQLLKIFRKQFALDIRIVTLGNHESPLRGQVFLTRDILDQLLAIKNGQRDRTIYLANPSAVRTWAFAPEIVRELYFSSTDETWVDTICLGRIVCSASELASAMAVESGLQGIKVSTRNLSDRPPELPRERLEIPQSAGLRVVECESDLSSLAHELVWSMRQEKESSSDWYPDWKNILQSHPGYGRA